MALFASSLEKRVAAEAGAEHGSVIKGSRIDKMANLLILFIQNSTDASTNAPQRSQRRKNANPQARTIAILLRLC
jgi:hypothetical protein